MSGQRHSLRFFEKYALFEKGESGRRDRKITHHKAKAKEKQKRGREKNKNKDRDKDKDE